jgi:DNA gyrase/topoisomerase IV subunit B
MKELRKLNKDVEKTNYRRVNKFCDALEKKDRYRCNLMLAEGDSAAKSLFAARGKTPYIGTYPLRGKLLNVRQKEIARVLGLDKKKEGKTEPNEIQKILTIIGLKIGEKVETEPMPDGEWVEIEINGVKKLVNENDSIEVDGALVKISSLL